MIDATQLPRAPSTQPAKNAGAAVATASGEIVAKLDASAEQARASVKSYPAKQLIFVAGRYRAVDHLK